MDVITQSCYVFSRLSNNLSFIRSISLREEARVLQLPNHQGHISILLATVMWTIATIGWKCLAGLYIFYLALGKSMSDVCNFMPWAQKTKVRVTLFVGALCFHNSPLDLKQPELLFSYSKGKSSSSWNYSNIACKAWNKERNTLSDVAWFMMNRKFRKSYVKNFLVRPISSEKLCFARYRNLYLSAPWT